ncbi:MAG: DUF1036 domain-containing protein [Proteobacteria bacterium]|nr:DUF1036 domain-containing protein [Pseudomonadota bacterium]
MAVPAHSSTREAGLRRAEALHLHFSPAGRGRPKVGIGGAGLSVGSPSPLPTAPPSTSPRRGEAKRSFLTALAFVAGCLAFAPGASAETRLCNRTSVVTEAAIGLIVEEAAATRGWFRLDPGQCRAILQTADMPGRLFLHSRPMGEPAGTELGQPAQISLCVGEGDFLIAGARTCNQPNARLAAFAEVRPTVAEGIAVLFLSEEADYDLPQARRAGIQRLLTRMGYDPGPIDGLDGPKTEAALRAFIADRNLPAEANMQADFFDLLLAAMRAGEGPGFAWCNDTGRRVMAALGTDQDGRIVTRGWFRIEAGACLKPPLEGAPASIYSFAEAVDAEGQPVQKDGRPVTFGGNVPGCVRPAEFEIAGADDCAAHGATRVQFLAVTFDGRRRASVRFRE